MGRVVTQADVDGIPPGGTLTVSADATITRMAEERARQRNVRIERSAAAGGRPGPAAASPGDERELVRAVTRQVVAKVGSAGPAVVDAVVAEVLASLGSTGGPPAPASAPFTNPRGARILPVVGGAGPSVDVCLACVEQEKSRKRSRAVLTTTGKNSKGIVAAITRQIADMGGDILDISQTLVSDFFTMIIVIDVGALTAPYERFQEQVTSAVKGFGCQAMMMHEEVLTSLHRI